MIDQHLAMGIMLTLASLWAWFHVEWFVTETPKGKALTARFSQSTARWFFRILFATGIVLGVGFITNLIRPIQW